VSVYAVWTLTPIDPTKVSAGFAVTVTAPAAVGASRVTAIRRPGSQAAMPKLPSVLRLIDVCER
jgi:hypothetical protein